MLDKSACNECSANDASHQACSAPTHVFPVARLHFDMAVALQTSQARILRLCIPSLEARTLRQISTTKVGQITIQKSRINSSPPVTTQLAAGI
uniref:Uncharacterized protein n=1 Tax=Hyaloperonospora arabidopsidis (strain Emoy2) TaxID=559515 RepID=M4BV43_HYAAE